MADILDSENTRIAGVLGGMGPDATIDFMSKVLSLTAADIDEGIRREQACGSSQCTADKREGFGAFA